MSSIRLTITSSITLSIGSMDLDPVIKLIEEMIDTPQSDHRSCQVEKIEGDDQPNKDQGPSINQFVVPL